MIIVYFFVPLIFYLFMFGASLQRRVMYNITLIIVLGFIYADALTSGIPYSLQNDRWANFTSFVVGYVIVIVLQIFFKIRTNRKDK